MTTTTKVYYRVLTPSSFSDLNFPTLEKAQKGLEDFGNVPETSEYFQYWQERKAQCQIVKVTEILEQV